MGGRASREVEVGGKHRQFHGTDNVLHPQLGGGFTGIHFIIMSHNLHAIYISFLNINFYLNYLFLTKSF